mmetsp:Transcript_770/g.1282  ORF Transcript_770/g.1282 Transcript_770/m.1282 type:complete len:237 (+) Transcript_770:102-812(+)|eukprot:CAMPEP_0185027734 /NCGR_PEP_ID=MMETSP1103-20130426/12946_1 /TAXON_ID=36769 /ORGANISM="Paraphysomonas bandaiensis, Strain Caron Lab Isolate" /LENGTH=236 /DNA_ID=CAMNT_0027561845 /DNA_START=87 /DNA_END=797 /DNA_ORIENTATION=-
MYADDTPRSDFGFGTPRDDRFYTPRGIQPTSSSDEWQTPRNGPLGNTSDGDYGTPRTGDYKDYKDYNDYKNGNYVVADPHSYWNNVAAHASYNAYQDTSQQVYPQDSKYNDDDDYENGLGIMEGVSEQDVEDIFSYARHGRCADMERLLDRGIPLNVRDEYGNTILTIACQNGNKKVAKAVLRRGADINARNHKGNTPLHYCFHYGYGDTLGQYLMTKGADATIRNNAGLPCWDGV